MSRIKESNARDRRERLLVFLDRRLTVLENRFQPLTFDGLILPHDVALAEDLGIPLFWMQARLHAQWLGLDPCFPEQVMREDRQSPIGKRMDWRRLEAGIVAPESGTPPCLLMRYWFLADAMELVMRMGVDLKTIAQSGPIPVSAGTEWLKGIMDESLVLPDLLPEQQSNDMAEPSAGNGGWRDASIAPEYTPPTGQISTDDENELAALASGDIHP